MNITSHLIIGLIFLFLLLIYSPTYRLSSNVSEGLSQSPVSGEWIKIVNPITSQNISSGKELLVSGQSSDSPIKNCSVSLIVNDVRPYQNAVATGKGGMNDFSQWQFVLHSNYTAVIDGQNKITAKLMCTSLPTHWNTVIISGIPNHSNEQILNPIHSAEQANMSSQNLSDIEVENGSRNVLNVSIIAQKNTVARGNIQNATITVTDSDHKPVANAELNGKLTYPGGNYEKEFEGMTGIDGKFIYSWVIGKKGDLGQLVMNVDVSKSPYESRSATTSFLLAPSEFSINDNESHNSIKNAITLVAAGDFYCDANTKKTTNAMQERNPDFVLALGDLSEVKNPGCFFKLFSKVDKADKIKVVLGSDDTDNTKDHSSRYNQYMRHFNMEEPYYSFDYQNIHFLAMATGDDRLVPFGSNSTQYAFISNDLAQTSSNKNIDWIIVFGYRPFYSSPSIHPGTQSIRNSYPPLFEKYGVDLVIAAHNHNYQRTYPIVFNSERPGKPIIKDVTNTSDYQNPSVPIYVTAGTGGAPPHELIDQSPFIANQFSDTGFLFVNITKTDTEKKLQAAFQSSNNGTDIDRFSITK